jgi:hypothetical protein
MTVNMKSVIDPPDAREVKTAKQQWQRKQLEEHKRAPVEFMAMSD